MFMIDRSLTSPSHIPGWFKKFVDGRNLTNLVVFTTKLRDDVIFPDKREGPGIQW